MVKEFRCDLHIHSCLSPCAELEMYPSAVVAASLNWGLDIIGICDHNASENVRYVIKAAENTPLTVFPGMEVTSKEEVHILGLFENVESLYKLQEIVYGALPGENDEDIFGCQAIVNELDEVEGFNKRLLIGSTTLSLRYLTEAIKDLQGIAVAAHIDRESFGIIGQLGFIPDDVRFDALEVSFRTDFRTARLRYPELAHQPIIQSSDAHRIEEIGRGGTVIRLEKPTVAELKLALSRRGGRYIVE